MMPERLGRSVDLEHSSERAMAIVYLSIGLRQGMALEPLRPLVDLKCLVKHVIKAIYLSNGS